VVNEFDILALAAGKTSPEAFLGQILVKAASKILIPETDPLVKTLAPKATGGLFGGGALGSSPTTPLWVRIADGLSQIPTTKLPEGPGAGFPRPGTRFPEDPQTEVPPPTQEPGVIDQVFTKIKVALEDIGNVFSDIFSTVKDTLSGIGGDLLDIFKNMGGDISEIFSTLFTGFQQGAGELVKFIAAAFFHTGGTVGDGRRTRMVPLDAFKNAQRFHSGSASVPGLKSNEVPAVLEKGERVLTERQAAMTDAALAAGSRGGELAIRNVIVDDPNRIPDAIASAQGERALLTFIQKNKATVRQIIG
jgi:hypothetical protein